MRRSLFFMLAGTLLMLGCKEKTASIVSSPDVQLLNQTFEKKNKWLIEDARDSLRTIIHPQALYGHSNCWIQGAEDMVGPENKEELFYTKIDVDHKEVRVMGFTGVIQGVGKFGGQVEDTSFEMDLCFVETYTWVDDKWQLVGRQAAKIK